MKKLKIALVGNPNVGKTSILNHLVGSNLKIGNWSGVTVEKKEGHTFFQDYEITFIDLPGVYTLQNPSSEDEKVTLNFLLNEDYDVILNIIETPRLERDLFLTVQLLDFEKPLVLLLNMIDEAEKMGIKVDEVRLSELLRTKVVKTVGRTGDRVKEILPAVVEVYEKEIKPLSINYSEEIEALVKKVKENSSQPKWFCLETLSEKDPLLGEMIKEKRLMFSQGIAKEVSYKKLLPRENITEILDNLLLHPIFGIFFFIFIMYCFFKISFDFSSPFIEWIDSFTENFLAPLTLRFLNDIGAPTFFSSFFSSAVIGGVGIVLTFLPLIFTMYFLLTLLETSGYLPRVAFLMDRFTHKIGLHGQSVIPLILGFGCNVPAVIATRTFQDVKDKFIVMSIIPFISCPARLVVFSFIAMSFFKKPAILIFILYLTGIILGILTSFVLRKTFYKKTLSHFVMDLPPYRIPSFKVLFNIVKIHLKDFVYKAGTVIFLVSVGIWLLLNLPPGVKSVEKSYAGKIGKALSYVFSPIGLGDWKISTSIISGFLAREAIISNMGVILTETKETPDVKNFNWKTALKKELIELGEAFKDSIISLFHFLPGTFEVSLENSSLRQEISKIMNKRQAISFLLFVLIYNSCLATVVMMWREGSKRFALGFLGYSFVLAWVLCFISYHFILVWFYP